MKNFLFLSLLLVACANPIYAPSEQSSGSQQKSDGRQAAFPSGGGVSIAWKVGPSEASANSLLFRTYRLDPRDGFPVPQDLGEVTVDLWMPSMNHGSAPVTVTQIGIGTYEATDIYFPMKGEWDMRFYLKDANGNQDKTTISFIF